VRNSQAARTSSRHPPLPRQASGTAEERDASLLEDGPCGGWACPRRSCREQSGKFKKNIDIEPVLDDLELSPKDLRILRMSALRSASYLEIGLDVPLEEKLRTTLETSRAFERYILGSRGSPSSHRDE